MREVVPGKLWLSGALEARDPRRLFELGITVVVDLALEELPAQLPREITYLRIPLSDGAVNDRRWLQLAINTVAILRAMNLPTLVCCSGGMSRSPLLAAAAQAVLNHRPLTDCLLEFAAGGPRDISPLLLQDVQATAEHLGGQQLMKDS